jgi:hypothetical protein
LSEERCRVCLLPVEPRERATVVVELLTFQERQRVTPWWVCEGCGGTVNGRLLKKAAAAND